jgi:glycosyltransferase involved in cell wall biosynthesis
LKILQMVQTLDPRTGGVARAVRSTSEALLAAGAAVEIVALDEPSAPWLQETRVPVHALGSGLTSYRYSPKLLPWLRANRSRFDGAIVNGIWQYMSFAAWRCFAGSAMPYFVFPHGMLDPWFKSTFPLKHVKKWFSWPWADYRVLRDARAVIYTSDEERIQARKSFWLYRARERVVALGVQPPERDTAAARDFFLRAHPSLQNKRCLLFLGRLHPKKGCDLLIDALATVSKKDELIIALAGPDEIGWRRELHARASRFGLDSSVVFLGMLEGDLKTGALAAADAFILPSHQENFGLAVVEALAAGLPVLISNRVNIWRAIESDGAGYVEADDVAGTIRLITRWIETSEEQRSAMRLAAQKCFAARFSLNHSAEELLALLREAVPAR